MITFYKLYDHNIFEPNQKGIIGSYLFYSNHQWNELPKYYLDPLGSCQWQSYQFYMSIMWLCWLNQKWRLSYIKIHNDHPDYKTISINTQPSRHSWFSTLIGHQISTSIFQRFFRHWNFNIALTLKFRHQFEITHWEE